MIERFCEFCGAPLHDDVEFCPNCGTPVPDETEMEEEEPETLTALKLLMMDRNERKALRRFEREKRAERRREARREREEAEERAREEQRRREAEERRALEEAERREAEERRQREAEERREREEAERQEAERLRKEAERREAEEKRLQMERTEAERLQREAEERAREELRRREAEELRLRQERDQAVRRAQASPQEAPPRGPTAPAETGAAAQAATPEEPAKNKRLKPALVVACAGVAAVAVTLGVLSFGRGPDLGSEESRNQISRIFAGAVPAPQPGDLSLYGTTLANVVQGSHVVAKGTDLFYVSADGHAVWHAKTDGTDNYELYRAGSTPDGSVGAGAQIHELFVAGDSLIFCTREDTVYDVVVRPLTTDASHVLATGTCEIGHAMQVSDGRVWRVDGKALRSCDFEGNDGRTESALGDARGWVVDGSSLYLWGTSVTRHDIATGTETVIYESEGDIDGALPLNERLYVTETSPNTDEVDQKASGLSSEEAKQDADIAYAKVVSVARDGADRICYLCRESSTDDVVMTPMVTDDGTVVVAERTTAGTGTFVSSYTADGTPLAERTAVTFDEAPEGAVFACDWLNECLGRLFLVPRSVTNAEDALPLHSMLPSGKDVTRFMPAPAGPVTYEDAGEMPPVTGTGWRFTVPTYWQHKVTIRQNGTHGTQEIMPMGEADPWAAVVGFSEVSSSLTTENATDTGLTVTFDSGQTARVYELDRSLFVEVALGGNKYLRIDAGDDGGTGSPALQMADADYVRLMRRLVDLRTLGTLDYDRSKPKGLGMPDEARYVCLSEVARDMTIDETSAASANPANQDLYDQQKSTQDFYVGPYRMTVPDYWLGRTDWSRAYDRVTFYLPGTDYVVCDITWSDADPILDATWGTGGWDMRYTLGDGTVGGLTNVNGARRGVARTASGGYLSITCPTRWFSEGTLASGGYDTGSYDPAGIAESVVDLQQVGTNSSFDAIDFLFRSAVV